MKVYINREVRQGPWGGGNLFTQAFHEMAPKCKDVEVKRGTTMGLVPDVILLAGLDEDGPSCISAEQAIMYKMYAGPNCKIILRVNENDARKGTRGVDDMLIKVSAHIDGTVFVSKWLQEYFLTREWACANQTVIYNGCQRSVFNPQPKLNNGKLNIVAHHWSDNYMKGADIYEEIDKLVGEYPDKFAFTYIGRHQCNFQHTKVIKPLHGKALGEELGKYDVYISGSRFDPGPNHVLEALACGLPTYVHKNGGGAVEFAGEDHAYEDWTQLKSILMGPSIMTNHFIVPEWNACVQEYVAYCERVMQAV